LDNERNNTVNNSADLEQRCIDIGRLMGQIERLQRATAILRVDCSNYENKITGKLLLERSRAKLVD